jgi:hypothetical protein
LLDTREPDLENTTFSENTEDDNNVSLNNVSSDSKNIFNTYNVEASFPSEIDFDEEILIFTTAIHLDNLFKKSDVISALNYSSRISNQGKYFIYDPGLLLPRYLYLYINDDGRWTAWMTNNTQFVNVLTQEDFMRIFTDFLETMKNCFKDMFDKEYEPNLVVSNPIFDAGNFNTTDLPSIKDINYFSMLEKMVIHTRLTKLIASQVGGEYSDEYIDVKGLNIHINLVLNLNDVFDLIPMTRIFENFRGSLEYKPEKFANLNIIIENEEEKEVNTQFTFIADELLARLRDTTDIYQGLEVNHTISLSPADMEKFILHKRREPSPMLEGIAEIINEVVYDRAMNENYEGTEELIDACIKIPNCGSYPWATKGLLYLRDEKYDVKVSEEKGIEYYQKSIEIEKELKNIDENNKELYNLKQKYYLEMSIFYLYRKKDKENFQKYYKHALDIGEEGDFYKDVLKLSEDASSEEYLVSKVEVAPN